MHKVLIAVRFGVPIPGQGKHFSKGDAMKTLLVFFLGVACVSDCFAGDVGGLFGRRFARRSAKAECAACTITETKETPAVIKTESTYKKTGEKVTIVPVESAKKAK